MAQTLKIVKQDTVYETIHSYITESSKSITNYEEMIEVVLDMIKDGHCFLMDRDILRDALETLTYMYEPNDDMNKDRVILQLVDINEDDEDEDGGDAGMDMRKNLGKMMGMPDMDNMMKGEGEETAEDEPSPEPAPEPKDDAPTSTDDAPEPTDVPASTDDAPASTDDAPEPTDVPASTGEEKPAPAP